MASRPGGQEGPGEGGRAAPKARSRDRRPRQPGRDKGARADLWREGKRRRGGCALDALPRPPTQRQRRRLGPAGGDAPLGREGRAWRRRLSGAKASAGGGCPLDALPTPPSSGDVSTPRGGTRRWGERGAPGAADSQAQRRARGGAAPLDALPTPPTQRRRLDPAGGDAPLGREGRAWRRRLSGAKASAGGSYPLDALPTPPSSGDVSTPRGETHRWGERGTPGAAALRRKGERGGELPPRRAAGAAAL